MEWTYSIVRRKREEEEFCFNAQSTETVKKGRNTFCQNTMPAKRYLHITTTELVHFQLTNMGKKLGKK